MRLKWRIRPCRGLDVAQRLIPDIVLLEIQLPWMNGYDVARRLRAHPVLGTKRLLALSDLAQPEHREQARAAGFDRHLLKPVDPEELEPSTGRTGCAMLHWPLASGRAGSGTEGWRNKVRNCAISGGSARGRDEPLEAGIPSDSMPYKSFSIPVPPTISARASLGSSQPQRLAQSAEPASSNGLNSLIPGRRKSFSFPVTTVRLCRSAIAAM